MMRVELKFKHKDMSAGTKHYFKHKSACLFLFFRVEKQLKKMSSFKYNTICLSARKSRTVWLSKLVHGNNPRCGYISKFGIMSG
jgi:hypothetical protein